jgi:hypothetical protein
MRLALPLTIISLALFGCVEMGAESEPELQLADGTSALIVDSPHGALIQFEPSSTSESFRNPERGYYTGYHLRRGADASSIYDAGYTLAIAIVNLEDYRDRSLDSTVLEQIDEGFDEARDAGIKLVVRFVYNDGYQPDATKDRILRHISQLTPVLRDNYDVIAVLQAGFIGAWGEWHSSTNGLDDDTGAHAQILAALLSALPSSRSVQVRTPMDKNAYRAGATSSSEAYSGSSRSRLGHHNDCFLATDSDYGTYASPVSTWKAYTAADTLYVPMGGETCRVYQPRTDCASAVAEMERHHWTYLNRAYKASVIDGWISQGCEGDIKRRLGYRLGLRRVAHSEETAPGGVLHLEMDIRNYGFAAPFNRRPVEVVLSRGTTRLVARLAFDARRLPGGVKTTVSTDLRVPANIAEGTYTLSVRMPDASSRLAGDPRYAIRLANSGSWDAATGDNVLTRSLEIDADAEGDVDSSARAFVEIP